MPNYRLTNEGEAKPTGITGTPLGGGNKRKPRKQRQPDAEAAFGTLALYVTASGVVYGVDVRRLTNAWADVRVLRKMGETFEPEGYLRKVGAKTIVAPTSAAPQLWWSWPSDDVYHYADRLARLKKNGRVEPWAPPTPSADEAQS